MKLISKLTFHLMFILLIVVSTPGLIHAQTVGEALKQDFIKMEQDLIARLKEHDTVALKNIVSNDYQLIGPLFRTVPHDLWMRNCLLWHFDSATVSRVSITGWENVAIVRSWQRFYNLKIGDDPIKNTEAWITDLFMKRDNKWQLATRVSERAPE